MGQTTDIEWCDSTCNPVMGCYGCELWTKGTKVCYAGRMTLEYEGKKGWPKRFEAPAMFAGRMAEAAKWKNLYATERPEKPWIPKSLPRLVFISDMGDALSKDVPFEFLKAEIIDTCRSWPHVGMWLTKRPKRMAEFSRWLMSEHGLSWPRCLWAGTSITSNENASRGFELTQVGDRSTTRFLSIEPLWSAIKDLDRLNLRTMNMVICGGESGAGAKVSQLIWFEELDYLCGTLGVKFFLKQLGSAHGIAGPKGGDWSRWPARMRKREFPAYEARQGELGLV